MVLTLLTVQTWILTAVILGSGADPIPGDPDDQARQAVRRSPFEAGPVREPAEPVERFYQRAARFKAEAEFLGQGETAVYCLDISEFILERVVTLQPDHGPAYLLWGESLCQRAKLVADEASRLELIAAADKKFRRAETGNGSDWNLYHVWGQNLTLLAYQMISDESARRRLLGDAIAVLERGAIRDDLAEHRGELLLSAGLAATILAENQDEAPDRSDWYRRAVGNYDEAVKLDTVLGTFHRGVLAEALYRLADLTEDTALARRSVAAGQDNLELQPRDGATHYNLACAYSVLGEHHLAVRHLETAAAADPAHLERARTDPVMRHLRASGAYAAFLETFPGQRK